MSTTESVFTTAQRLQQAGTPYALVSVIRALAPASARPGDKAVVTADGQLHGWVGGGCAQPAVLRTVRQVLADGRARLIRIAPAEKGHEKDLGDVLEFGMSCHSGGTLELFVDPVLPRARLVVIGASPVALSLTQLAPRVGFAVTLIAHQADVAAYADAHQVITSDDPAGVVPQVAAGAWVVVATQGRRDVQALRLALALKATQVSFVASARKAKVLKDSLVAAGADASAVNRIIAPAGYPMAAATPEEIALSVLAAVVSHRRGALVAASASSAGPEGAPDAALAGERASTGSSATTPAAATSAATATAASTAAGVASRNPLAPVAPVVPGAAPEAAASCCGGAATEPAPLPTAKPSCCGG